MVVVLLVILIIVVVAIVVGFNPRINIYSTAKLKTKDKLIALTFDDGPLPGATDKILDILKDQNVRATFFVVGKSVSQYPELVKRASKEGHLIGNHSTNHGYAMFRSSKTLLDNVETTSNNIYQAIGKKPTFYRPPFGLRTIWGARAIKKQGYLIVTWDNMTFDYWNLKSEKVVKNIINKADNGGVIVLHDGRKGFASSSKDNVVSALPEIISTLKSRGYKLVTLDQLYNVPGYR